MNKKGFTFVELLVVMVFLGIMALIIFPSITNLLKKTEDNRYNAFLNDVYLATEAYIQKNNDNYPQLKRTGGTAYIYMNNLVASRFLKSNLVNPNYCDENNNCQAKKISSCDENSDNCVIDDYTVIVTKKEDGLYSYELVNEILAEKQKYKCIRAASLHTEVCTQTDSNSYCSAAGYTSEASGTIITYGNLGTTGTLVSGDAFDCDVDGNGTYDNDERFYYVTDLESNNNYAVLIYYNNTYLKDGIAVADNTYLSANAYDESEENWHGPVSVLSSLPTTSDWKNVSLSSTSRTITTETGETTTLGGEIENPFIYTDKAARLITYQEMIKASENAVTSNYLDEYNYFLENTSYSSNSQKTDTYLANYWLENPSSTSTSALTYISPASRLIEIGANATELKGIRPVIEVLKTDIEIDF